MEIQKVYMKTRAEFGKQCVFDTAGPTLDVDIQPNVADMDNYFLKSHCHVGTQFSKQLALHEVQTIGKTVKNSGMYHFEGGWPKEINPKDEEVTARFRRRVEKDDIWAPKLRKLLEPMEHTILQNGAVNIYQHYFHDMMPKELVEPAGLRTVNVYLDPEMPKRPVTDIAWSPDAGSRIVVCYCVLDVMKQHAYSNRVYIWQVDNPNEPYMALDPFCPCVVSEFNPRDPSVLASGLMTGQVCNFDIRTGTKPVLASHVLYSHSDYANAIRWLPTKSNSEFFSTSSDGRAMWWDARRLRGPTETLMFDFQNPNDPDIDRLIGVSCLNYGPMVGTKFTFGTDNGFIVTGSRKAKTNAEKLAVRIEAHSGPVRCVDRNVFNPNIFLTVGDWTTRIWAEDTREGSLVSIPYLVKDPVSGCWNKSRHSVFYVATTTGVLLAWDLVQNLRQPVFTLKLCKEGLTTLAPYDEGTFLAIGNVVGDVFLVEETEFFQTFDKKERAVLSEYFERRSKVTKAVDARLKEIKLVQKIMDEEEEPKTKVKVKAKVTSKTKERGRDKERERMGGRESRISKDRRKSASKERKKRDDSPQLVHAEQRYFDMVQLGLDQYASESDPSLRPVIQMSQGKKQDKKHRRSSDALSEDDDATTRDHHRHKGKPKDDAKEPRKSKRIRVRKAKPPRVSVRLSERSITEEAPVESTTKLDLDEQAKTRRKERKPKPMFFLPVPCKGEICKPKICCWRKSRKRSGREVWTIEETQSSTESVEWTTVKPSKLSAKQTHILGEMGRPPLDVKLEADLARAEIQEMSLRPRPVPPELERAQKVRKVRRQKRISSKRKTVSQQSDKRVSIQEPEEEEEADTKVKEKPVVPIDPCSPPKAKSIVEELATILDIPTPKLTEEKLEGKDQLEKLELARSRVFPRISEYQG